MSRPKRTEAELQWRRERILAAAMTVFQRVGFAAATMEEIAREAEYSPAALYNYFRSKEEIFAAAMELAAERFSATLTEPLPPDLPFEAKLRWRARRSAETALANRAVLMTIESAAGPIALGCHMSRIRACHERNLSLWAELMVEGQQAGALRADVPADRLASVYLGLVRHTMAPLVASDPAPTLEELQPVMEQLIDLFLNGAKSA